MKPQLRRLKALILRHQLLTAIGLVVVITGILTGISMTLYIQSGASGLDLSRPGFSDSRKDLQQDASIDFKSTGNLTQTDVATFKKLYDKQRSILNSLSNFDDESFSDESLGLVVPEEPVE
ncbi:MAG: hypothetical protein ABIQ64_04025 [Candidatus Saccharimonadales bacterium]